MAGADRDGGGAPPGGRVHRRHPAPAAAGPGAAGPGLNRAVAPGDLPPAWAGAPGRSADRVLGVVWHGDPDADEPTQRTCGLTVFGPGDRLERARVLAEWRGRLPELLVGGCCVEPAGW
jgi:hypothetical protein